MANVLNSTTFLTQFLTMMLKALGIESPTEYLSVCLPKQTRVAPEPPRVGRRPHHHEDKYGRSLKTVMGAKYDGTTRLHDMLFIIY